MTPPYIGFPAATGLPHCIAKTWKSSAGLPLFTLGEPGDYCGAVFVDTMHGVDILFLFGDVEGCSQLARECWDDTPEGYRIQTGETVGGRFEIITPHKLVVWINQIESEGARFFGILGHECGHVTYHVARHVGIELSRKSEEWFCYYQQWLVNAVIECIGYNNDDG